MPWGKRGSRCCCAEGNVCDCPGNVDLTVSGVTAKQCSVADINTAFTSIGVVSSSGSESYIGSYTCTTLASANTGVWFPDKGYNNDSSSCTTFSGTNGAAIYLDSSGFIWLRIQCRWNKQEGFATRTWFYRDYFKSTAVLSSYSLGDTVDFTHVTQVTDGTLAGSYSDPGINSMPFDASTATVSMTFNGCCYLCDDSTPLEMQVVLTGVANDIGCSSCSQLNGTYILPATDSCEWQLCVNFDPDPACSTTTVGSMLVTMSNSHLLGTTTTEVKCQLYTGTCGSGFVAQQTFQNTTSNGRVNCEYSAENISASASSTFCDWSSATCTVTAL